MKPTRVITLYNNRKYYDKGLKGHITLLDIIQAVKDGDEFLVRDSTGTDITEKTINAAIYKHLVIPTDVAKDLVQNLYEIEVEKQNFLPTENNYDRL
jgi:polyhydroxyalkanoate synthesis regulator protein